MSKKKRQKKSVSPSKSIKSPRIFAAIFILLVIAFFAFSPSLQNSFTNWDDDLYVTENHQIKNLSIKNLGQIFTQFYGGAYIPLTISSFAIEYQFFRLSPRGYHTTNLILHLANILLVFLLMMLVSQNLFFAFFAALLFGIHPLRVESVAWITGRKDVLYGFFFLLALISYMHYKKASVFKFYYLSLVFFILALLAKPVAMIFPLIICLFDYLHSRQFNRKLIFEKIPYLILSFVFAVVAFIGQHSAGAVEHESLYSFFHNIIAATYGILFYLVKSIVPVNLSAIYAYPRFIQEFSLASIFVVLGIIVLIALIRISIKYTKKILFGALFFLFGLIPVLQIVPVGQALADRYTYIPSIGLVFIFCTGIFWVFQKFDQKISIKAMLSTALLAVVIIFSILTYKRCHIWRNSLTLWNDVLKKYPQIPIAYNDRGSAFFNIDEYEKALSDFDTAIGLKHEFPEAFHNRALVLLVIGKPKEAIEDFNQALAYNPQYADAYTDRGNAYLVLGKIDLAINDFNRAIRLNPTLFKAYNSRGTAYTELGNFDKAIGDYTMAIKYNADYYEAYYNRGNIYYNKKEFDKALIDYDQTLQLNPYFVDAYFNRANVNYAQRKYLLAINDYNSTLKLNPNYVPAYYYRGISYYRIKKYTNARSDMEKAIQSGYLVDQAIADTICSAIH
jgi:tetratricopeptide (TPR) repeat protein